MQLHTIFQSSGEFIHSCLESGGRVLVCCWQGASRSASLVLAYIISYKGMPLEKALRSVKQKRDIRPHNNFLLQLINFEEQEIKNSVL